MTNYTNDIFDMIDDLAAFEARTAEGATSALRQAIIDFEMALKAEVTTNVSNESAEEASAVAEPA